MKLLERLAVIQRELKCPKSQYNSFAKFSYRNCEDILEEVKPLLVDCVLTLSDEVVFVGNRYYIKATAELFNAEKEMVRVHAYAREEEAKKGMDASQISGAASSYARKYCLNGLLLTDDTKDADTDNKEETKPEPKPVAKNTEKDVPINPGEVSAEEEKFVKQNDSDQIVILQALAAAHKHTPKKPIKEFTEPERLKYFRFLAAMEEKK